MKKILKGFTLIELIIVMAILTILMAGIMQMFKPIRETYVDSTLYESQRTAQNGVVQYITESVRYSTDLGMYTMNKVSNAAGAIDKFADAYIVANGIDSASAAAVKTEIKKNAEVIIIDNDTSYSYGNANYTGRILRRKVDGTTLVGSGNEVAGTSVWRLALGAAYYGSSDYTITFGITQDSNKKGTASDGIKVTVASGGKYGTRERTVISNTGLILCKNQCAPINGMFDTTNYDAASSSAKGTKVYIVYLNDKITVS